MSTSMPDEEARLSDAIAALQPVPFTPHSSLALPDEGEVWRIKDAVDLTIEYTPVVPWPYAVRNNVPIPRRAQPLTDPERWIIIHDRHKPAESAEEVDVLILTLARARYLLYRNTLHKLFPGLLYSAKCDVAGFYFDGVVPFAEGRLHALLHKLPYNDPGTIR